MPYRRCAVKRGSAAVLVIAFVIVASCGGATGTTSTTTGGAGATAAVASGTAATGVPATAGPSFAQVLSSAKATEYKITYKLTTTVGADTITGEQSWFFKPPRARFDFSSTAGGQSSSLSLYALPDGTYMCFGGAGQTASCIGMTGLDTALQQNPAPLYHEALLQHPDQNIPDLVDARHTGGQPTIFSDVE